MLRTRLLAMASGLGAILLASVSAQAQTPPADEPAPQQPVVVEPPPAAVVPVTPVPAAAVPVVPTVNTTVIEPPPVVVVVPHPRNMGVSFGGGISNFFDETLRDRAGVQGAYEARVGFGLSSILGVEAAYVGTAGPIDTLGLDDNAVLISNGAEAMARINVIPTGPVQPFIVGGGSWMRYNVVNDSFNSSDVRDQDDVLAIPVGAGVAGYVANTGLMLDARVIYRATFDDELIKPTPNNSDGSSMSNWVATLRLGYTF